MPFTNIHYHSPTFTNIHQHPPTSTKIRCHLLPFATILHQSPARPSRPSAERLTVMCGTLMCRTINVRSGCDLGAIWVRSGCDLQTICVRSSDVLAKVCTARNDAIEIALMVEIGHSRTLGVTMELGSSVRVAMENLYRSLLESARVY